MSTASLRPILRPSTLPSLPISFTAPTPASKLTLPTYICTSCRHARLLRRPKRPYTFTQLVTLSDGSAFTMRTTSPQPVYRSTRDTRNAPLWNPSNKELANVEDDEAGRLAGFRARFGKGFDAQKEAAATGVSEEVVRLADESKEVNKKIEEKVEAQSGPFFQHATGTKQPQPADDMDEYYEFEEDDANLLDLISAYGTEVTGSKTPPPPGKASGKKGKK